MSHRTKNILLVLVIVIGYMLLSPLIGGTNIALDFGEDSLTVTGPKQYTYTIAYSDIASLELVEPEDFGTPVTGNENRNCRWGTWTNDAWGTYELGAAKKADKCVLITGKDGSLMAVNYTDDATTEELYSMFTELLAHYEGPASE